MWKLRNDIRWCWCCWWWWADDDALVTTDWTDAKLLLGGMSWRGERDVSTCDSGSSSSIAADDSPPGASLVDPDDDDDSDVTVTMWYCVPSRNEKGFDS